MRRVGGVLLCLVASALAAVPPAAAGPGPAASHPGPAAPAPDPAAARATAKAGFAHLPLRFEANQGQADAAARFVVRAGGSTAYLTAHEALLTVPRRPDKPDTAPTGVDVVEMALAGADANATFEGIDQLAGVSNYLIGNDPAAWHTDVPAYAKVRYSGVYPGVDLAWHGEGGQLEYDFEVAPGADPAPIALAVRGGDRPVVDAKGDLVTHAGTTEVRQHAPVAYQEIDGTRRKVQGRFVVRPDDSVGFALGEYDRHQRLVIDPAIGYATYLGGSGEDAVTGIALDASNNAYVTGWTTSADFPVASALQGSCAKCDNAGFNSTTPNTAAFVTKLNATGTAVAYSTYLGGTTGWEDGLFDLSGSIAVDSSGAAYVSGTTTSSDFPVVGGYKTTCGTATTPCTGSSFDVFVAKLAPAGSTLAYSSYIGGSGSEYGRGLALGASGIAYVGGRTTSTDFVSADAGSATPLQSSFGGGIGDDFVVKVNTAVTGAPSLVYSSFLGGAGSDWGYALAVDPAAPNVAYLAGTTASANFPTANAYQASLGGGLQSGTVSKIDTTAGASGLGYSSYLGGTTSGTSFTALAAKAGVAYLTGETGDATYPTTGTSAAYQSVFGGATDAVVTAVNTTLNGATSLQYSSFLGGSSGDWGYAIAVDAANLITVAGQSGGGGFPVSGQIQNFDSSAQVFVTRLDTTLAAAGLVYSTALGGNTAYAVAVDGASPANAYVGGRTPSGFPASSGAYQTTFGGSGSSTDGFVAKLTPGTQPSVSGLSTTHGPFTGGTSVTITGSGFTGATAVKFGTAAASFVVNSATQITASSPCASGAVPCPDTALGTATASTVNVTVTAGGATSAGNASARFTYGEGESAPAAACSACVGNPGLSVLLQNGKVLYTQTGSDSYSDGVATQGSPTFTSATRTFTAADVGKRLAADGSPKLYPRGTVIAAVVNAHTVTLSNPATASATAAGFLMSVNVTEVYDPAADTWTSTGACNGCGAPGFITGGATITLLNSGKVLVAGGSDPVAPYLPVPHGVAGVPDAFVYDPAAGTWAATGSLSVPRNGPTATLVAGGKVLVAGGSDVGTSGDNGVDATASAEVYDPITGTFSATGSMGTARAIAAAAVLPGGDVLVAGGYTTGTATGGVTVASAERYNPAAGTWAPAGSMSGRRANEALVVVPSSGACGANCGKALVVNGETSYYGGPVGAELYTPGSPGSWGVTATPASGRRPITVATLLPSGKVLATDSYANLAERFDPATATWASAGANLPGTSSVVLPAGPASVCGSHCGQVFVPRDVNLASAFYVPRPTITALNPASGGPGTTVTLTGTGLTAVSTVSFGGVAGTSVTHSSTSPDTTLTVVVPSGLSGAVGVLATSPGGASSTSGPQFALSTNIPTVVQSLVGQAMNTAAALTWSPPASNGGSTITGYTVVTNAPVNGAAHATVNLSPCSPTCSTTISGLSNSLSIVGQGAYGFTVYATNANGNGYAATSALVFPQITAGEFVPVTPGRILDTRGGGLNYGTCTPSPCATLGAGANPETYAVQVAGKVAQGTAAALVPAAGANAVVMNVTIVNPTAASVLTVFPSTSSQPGVSNLNWLANQAATPNLVTVALGTDGNVKINNAFGAVDVIADVVGYYLDGTTTAGARFNPVTPGRILDTRGGGLNYGTCTPSPCATLGNGANPQTYAVQVAGKPAQGTGASLVPPTGATAVVMNVTIVNPTAPSVLTAYPSDAAQPSTSNLNWSGGQGPTPNLVTVGLGADGNVKVTNAFGAVDVIADVVGWYTTAGSISGTRFAALVPGRILDTRGGSNYGSCTPSPCATLGNGANPQTYAVQVAGKVAQGSAAALVPATGATAVVMNVTIVNPTAASVLTVYPSAAAQPSTSNLNWVNAQAPTPNLVAVGLGTDGKVKVTNAFGAVDVIFDVGGWFNNGTS